MKVLCIDNKPYPTSTDLVALSKLKEGNTYTVIKVTNGAETGFVLKEVTTINKKGFWDKRFISLSEIDEMELVNKHELETS
jgi:hypothetical protein